MPNLHRRLQVPGELEQIRTACDFVSEVAREAGLSEDGVFHCQLSVEEICTNIIEHGYRYNGADKSIEIVCEKQGSMLIISILDDAAPFNPLQLEDPDPGMSLWEREGGGWGVFFVKQYMTSIRYELIGGRNCLILAKHITS